MRLRMLGVFALIVLSSAYPAAKIDSKQERAIAEVVRLGGKVELDETISGRPAIKVDLHGTQVTDSDLVLLKDLPKLLFA